MLKYFRGSWLIYSVCFLFYSASIYGAEVRKITREDIEWGDPSTTVTSPGGHVGHKIDNTYSLSSPRVDVRAFGADNTGVADSLAAYNLAKAAGNNIYFSGGTFKFSGSLHMSNGDKISCAGAMLTTLLFTNTDGIVFDNAALNDGYLHIEGCTIKYGDTLHTNTKKGIDFTATNYSTVKDVIIKDFYKGVYLQSVSGVTGCYFNKFNNVSIFNTKYAVELNDSVTGSSVNNNTFTNIHHEVNGAWDNAISYQVTGYGNRFIGIYGSGYTGSGTEFLRFAEGSSPGSSIVGNTLIVGAYIESSPSYGFRIPNTTSARYGNTIIGVHFDGATGIANYSDPLFELTILNINGLTPDSRGITTRKLSVSGPTEPYIKILGNTREWRLYSGGGSDFGAGEFVIRDFTGSRSPFRVMNNAPTLSFIITNLGDISLGVAGKGIVLKNAADNVTKRVRLNNLGDGLIFEAE